MSNRLWFFASGNTQQGPYSEDQLRDFIARGAVKSDTFVWTEGMSAWQKAGDIPGLLSGDSSLRRSRRRIRVRATCRAAVAAMPGFRCRRISASGSCSDAA
jgi:hypothetical protein